MKLFLYALLIVAGSACSETDLALRYDLVGSYKVNYQRTDSLRLAPLPGVILQPKQIGSTVRGPGQVSITKGSGADGLIITSEGISMQAFLASKGNAFDIPSQTTPFPYKGTMYALTVSGSGTGDGQSLTLTYRFSGQIDNQPYAGFFSGSGSR